jgi:hypothetical protein
MQQFIQKVIQEKKVLINTKYYTGNRYDSGLKCTFQLNDDYTGTFTEEYLHLNGDILQIDLSY